MKRRKPVNQVRCDEWQEDKPPDEVLHRVDLVEGHKDDGHERAAKDDVTASVTDGDCDKADDLREEADESA